MKDVRKNKYRRAAGQYRQNELGCSRLADSFVTGGPSSNFDSSCAQLTILGRPQFPSTRAVLRHLVGGNDLVQSVFTVQKVRY